MDEHPGIVFRDGPTGRRAALAGGPDVWEVIATLKGGKARGEEAISSTPGLLDRAHCGPLLRRLYRRDRPADRAQLRLRDRGHDVVATTADPSLRGSTVHGCEFARLAGALEGLLQGA